MIRNRVLNGEYVEWFNDTDYVSTFEMVWMAYEQALLSCKNCDKTFIVHADGGNILLNEADKAILNKHRDVCHAE